MKKLVIKFIDGSLVTLKGCDYDSISYCFDSIYVYKSGETILCARKEAMMFCMVEECTEERFDISNCMDDGK